ncbi:hypothetical protein CEE44_04465 [Candidatus Woesearchaeota archaeon B3_Woes]|nr:MAG: hypothetical protein CEE44_04465 [Candidatus Woesearchaeota archaeon B3_Woes]
MAKGNVGKVQDDKLWGFLAIFLGIIGFLIVLLTKRDSEYAMYYAKQSLVLFIACICVGFVAWIPFIGWFLLGPILYIVILVLWVIGWVRALSGEMKPIPIIGKLAEKIKL